MKRGGFNYFTFSSRLASTVCRYLPSAQVTPSYAIQGGNFSVVRASGFASEQGNKKWFRMRSSWFLFPTVVTLGGVMLYQALPDEDSYAYQQFMTNTTGENKCVENYLRWSSILIMTGVFEKLSQYDVPFYLMRSFVEHYLEFRYHTIFQENKNNRVYFRGEYRKGADELLSSRKHRIPLPYSLCSGQFSLPYVKDQTLEFVNPGRTSSHPNGFTKGVISLTSSIEVTEVYGNAEAVIFVVPQGRIAPVAHHAIKDAQNFQYEHICGGIRVQDILFIGYRDSNTLEFNGVEFNPYFEGDIDKLELDPQMQSVINAIPDNDSRKVRLNARINPALDYRDSYDQLVADDEHSHKQALPERLNHIATHGFNGNKLLRSLHRQYHGAGWDYASQQQLLIQPMGYFSYTFTAPQTLKVNTNISAEKPAKIVTVNETSSPVSQNEIVSSPTMKRSFSSPARTYSQLNFRAQDEMKSYMEKMAASPLKNKQEDLSGVVVSKRAVLGSAYDGQSRPLPRDEKEALDNFAFGVSFSRDVSVETKAKHAQAASLHLEDVLEVCSDADSDSDSDNEEKDDKKIKRQSALSAAESPRKASDVSALSASWLLLFARHHHHVSENAVVSPALDSPPVLQ